MFIAAILSGEIEMVTTKQLLGERGEVLVVQKCSCPRCGRLRSLKRLRANFKCADLICDFCGFLAQVKTSNQRNINSLPRTVLGAAWSVQKERMDAGYFFPLYLVLVDPKRKYSIYFLDAKFQKPEIFRPRSPLSATARRAGWQGFMYDINETVAKSFVRLV